jgi:hypothetical protein
MAISFREVAMSAIFATAEDLREEPYFFECPTRATVRVYGVQERIRLPQAGHLICHRFVDIFVYGYRVRMWTFDKICACPTQTKSFSEKVCKLKSCVSLSRANTFHKDLVCKPYFPAIALHSFTTTIGKAGCPSSQKTRRFLAQSIWHPS